MADASVRRVPSIGLMGCVALVVGNMIGSGIFLLPSSLAPYGWNAVFGWVVTISGGMFLAITFAFLASHLPVAGGPYAYTRAAFGQTAGFLVAWAYWISLWVGNAGIAIGAISYLSGFVPGFERVPGLPAAATCALVWSLTALNCFGVRALTKLQIATTLLKLLPLVAVLVVAALVLADTGVATVPPLRSADIHLSSISTCATLTLWGLLGLESATVPADAVKDAKRTIPRATLIGTAVTGMIYLFVCSAVTLLSPPAQTARSAAPIADFVASHSYPLGGTLVALFAAISAIGALGGWIMLQGELPAAMARDGVFPAWLGRLSRRETPANAHIASSTLLTIVLLFNYQRSMEQLFTFLALLATTASLFAYLASSLGALRLAANSTLVLTGPLLCAILLATAYSLWTLYGAGAVAVGWGLVLLLLGLPLHLVMRMRRRSPPGNPQASASDL